MKAVPVTQLTVIEADPIEGDPATWLEGLRGHEDARQKVLLDGHRRAVRALAARRVASADPGVPDIPIEGALSVRLGYGIGDALVEGDYAEAIELPLDSGRQSRAAALRPQERMAALLGGRSRSLACEELILRARADVDAGRDREATLQLRVGLEALLAEKALLGAAGQSDDLAFLDSRRTQTGEAANEALKGRLSAERLAEVTETLSVCERALRRQAAHG